MISNNSFLSRLSRAVLEKMDIIGLQKIFRDLAEEHSDILTVFNSMAEGIIVIDAEGHVLFYNKSCSSLLPIFKSSQNNIQIEEFIKDKEIQELLQKMLKKNDKINQENIIFGKDSPRYLNLTLQPMVNNHRIIGNILSIRDISTEHENKSIGNMQTFSALTAGLAHEIRNPLGSLSIHIQLLQQEISELKCEKTEDMSLSLSIVNEEIERLNKILTDFLYSVRPLKAVLQPVNFRAYLDKIADFIVPELESKNIKLEREYRDSQPIISIDENIFRQAIINLIENSIAAIDETGRKDGKIIISSSEKHGYLYLEIKDNGSGIPKEEQNKIFEPYFTTKSSGSGLGLMIVYKVVKEHMGNIQVTSSLGKGAAFTIALPLGNKNRLIGYHPEKEK